MLQEGCNDVNAITLTENGVIHTSEKTDLACIHARDRSSGRSEIAACVRVAEVNDLLLSLKFLTPERLLSHYYFFLR